MDFGDLELDDDVDHPFAHPEHKLSRAEQTDRGVEAEALPATACDRTLPSYENLIPGNAQSAGQNSTRIPGPAGQLQFQVGNGSSDDALGDSDFHSSAWRSATLNATETVPIKSIGESERVSAMVVVLASICSSATGNAYILLKDPSGTLQGSMLRSCFLLRDKLQLGVVLVLRKVPVLHVAPGQSFCCISPSNIFEIFNGLHHIEGLVGQENDEQMRTRAHHTPVARRQSIPDQSASMTTTVPETTKANTVPASSQSAAAVTDCTVPDIASSFAAHIGEPTLSTASTPGRADARRPALASLQADDTFQPHICSPLHRDALTPGTHISTQPSSSLHQDLATAQQTFSHSDAQAALTQPGTQQPATSRFHASQHRVGTPSQHAGHTSAANMLTKPHRPQVTCQSDSPMAPRAWVENLKQHIRKKQQQSATHESAECSAPRPSLATQPVPGRGGAAAAEGRTTAVASLAERIRSATSRPGSTQRDRPTAESAGCSQGEPAQAQQLATQAFGQCHEATASRTTAPGTDGRVTAAPAALCTGAPSHISTGSRSTSRTTALLSRLKTGPRTQGGPCTGPAASGHGGSLNTRKDDPSTMHAVQHGLSSVSHSKFAPAGRIGVIGQSGRCGRQVPSKRPHALCSRQQEALEAAGLGFSQSSGDFC